ncbi:MAG: hypothetical protein PF542_00860 [Nanoarchaeota archaeon]|jgi:hypothetical protein|nr:hypothetical protein [Nanoarchaeota archaeon]
MEKGKDYVKFEDIPKEFYDHTLDGVVWEDKLISNLKLRYGSKGTTNFSGESVNIFPDTLEFQKNNSEEWFEKMEMESSKIIEPTFEEKVMYDKNLRAMLYDKGMNIPNNEMNREFYLRERLTFNERSNLVALAKGFSKFMGKRNIKKVDYALFGVGTSTYPEEYYCGIEKMFLDNGKIGNSVIREKAAALQKGIGEEIVDWEKSVEFCYNYAKNWDSIPRPISKEEFYEKLSKTQFSYEVDKKVSDILENKGEDLDFAFSLEEYYGSKSFGPQLKYSRGNSEYEFKNKRSIDILKNNFKSFLKESGNNFKEEVSKLEKADYNLDWNGELIRRKIITPNTGRVETLRVNFDLGRSMHFYFYNQVADMKVKGEIIHNDSFSQVIRGVDNGLSGVSDLEAAVKNGEETGVFENPLVLKWKE